MALNHTVQFEPMVTSPTTTAVSAKKQFSPNFGVYPLTSFMIAMAKQLIEVQS
jgi:hypothetical protein